MKLIDLAKKYSLSNVYLVIDSAQITESIRILLREIKKDGFSDIYSLFANTKENNIPWEVAPLLLNFSRINNIEILNILEKYWLEKNVIQLLVVDKDLPEKILIKKLQKLFEINLEGDILFFRWFDPRVCGNLNHLFSNLDLAEVYKDIQFWFVKYLNISTGKEDIKNMVKKSV